MAFKLKLNNPQNTFDKHQLKIARASMRMSCLGCRIMGGMNHYEASSAIHRITGAYVQIEADCTCKPEGRKEGRKGVSYDVE